MKYHDYARQSPSADATKLCAVLLRHGLVNMVRTRRGITGLETAIILIAFVIVASVFAFAVLNMGMLTTQKAGSAVKSGMKQASSALQLSGSVIAYDYAYNSTTGDFSADLTSGEADAIVIYVKLAPGKEPVDTSTLVISYTTKQVHVSDLITENSTAIQNGVYPVIFKWINADNDALLEQGETLEIIINVGGFDSLGPNEWFKVEIKPSMGAVLAVERTLPAAIEQVMDLG